MKKFIGIVKKIFWETYYEILGHTCEKCGAKHSVFFLDHTLVKGKWKNIYKCKSCEIEGIKD